MGFQFLLFSRVGALELLTVSSVDRSLSTLC